jgi:hypothetical protein
MDNEWTWMISFTIRERTQLLQFIIFVQFEFIPHDQFRFNYLFLLELSLKEREVKKIALSIAGWWVVALLRTSFYNYIKFHPLTLRHEMMKVRNHQFINIHSLCTLDLDIYEVMI